MSNHSDTFATVGIDIAKNVFQVYACNSQTGEITNESVRRNQLLKLFENRKPCLIGMEACGGSQYWARELTKLGHAVRLMDGKLVKPFVSRNKSDRADAEGIHAALAAGVRTVAVRDGTECDIHTLLTMRQRLVNERMTNINHVRGLLLEYGVAIDKSTSRFDKQVDEGINGLEGRVSQLVVEQLRATVSGIRSGSRRIADLTAGIANLARRTKHANNLLTVPGVGVVTMAYMSVLLADPKVYESARQFAAFLGLVPMHWGSGGKTITTHIPGRCNKRLRALLVECANAVARSRKKTPWVEKILKSKPRKVALIAIANRIARQCWAVADKSQPWRMITPATA